MQPSTEPPPQRTRRPILLTVRRSAVVVGFQFGRFLPIQRRVVLATSHDPELRGNLAVIQDALEHRWPDLPVTVVTSAPRGVGRRRGGRIGRILRMARGAVRAGYLLARTRVFIVDDYYFPVYVVRPRPGTTIVQTWHAAGAFKKFGYSVLDKGFGADEEFVAKVAIHSNYDVCLVSSMAVAEHYSDAFRLPMDRFTSRIGLPRTDVLFDPGVRGRAGADVRQRYDVPADKRIVLYAPTFRGTSIGRAEAGMLLDLDRLQAVLAADHVVLVRLHPFVRSEGVIEPRHQGFAVDVSGHPDINDLLLASDILVTDYSSVIFEYALLDRPMVFFAPDLADYENERGFYFDYRSGVPGPVYETTEDVAAYLRAGAFDRDRLAAFRTWAWDVADGHATDRFLDEIVLPALDGDPIALGGGHPADAS
jgi:teichoic acid ribitol-phosphate primase